MLLLLVVRDASAPAGTGGLESGTKKDSSLVSRHHDSKPQLAATPGRRLKVKVRS